MEHFALDPRLENDCRILGKLGCCRFLLMDNALFPWFILVPETGAVELCDLDRETRLSLSDLTDRVARFVRENFKVDKLNVAAIGNVVRQLHVHVIGRKTGDPCWPGVVWGSGKSEPYSEAEMERMVQRVRTGFPELE
jgi:diadenosine tetraphosphate (Ap4A) HIT family hydrolase